MRRSNLSPLQQNLVSYTASPLGNTSRPANPVSVEPPLKRLERGFEVFSRTATGNRSREVCQAQLEVRFRPFRFQPNSSCEPPVRVCELVVRPCNRYSGRAKPGIRPCEPPLRACEPRGRLCEPGLRACELVVRPCELVVRSHYLERRSRKPALQPRGSAFRLC